MGRKYKKCPRWHVNRREGLPGQPQESVSLISGSGIESPLSSPSAQKAKGSFYIFASCWVLMEAFRQGALAFMRAGFPMLAAAHHSFLPTLKDMGAPLLQLNQSTGVGAGQRWFVKLST